MSSGRAEASAIPPREVTDRLAVRVVRPLGGRANGHWLVVSGDTRLVLRCCAARPLGDIAYELRVMVGWTAWDGLSRSQSHHRSRWADEFGA